VTGETTLAVVISLKSALLTDEWKDDFKTGVSKITMSMGSGWNVLQIMFHDSDIIGVILLPEVTNNAAGSESAVHVITSVMMKFSVTEFDDTLCRVLPEKIICAHTLNIYLLVLTECNCKLCVRLLPLYEPYVIKHTFSQMARCISTEVHENKYKQQQMTRNMDISGDVIYTELHNG
jgi:hypothetical protein